MSGWEQTTLDKVGKLDWGRNEHFPQNDALLFEGGEIPYVEARDIQNRKLYITGTKFYNE